MPATAAADSAAHHAQINDDGSISVWAEGGRVRRLDLDGAGAFLNELAVAIAQGAIIRGRRSA